MDFANIFEYEFGVQVKKRSGKNWVGRCCLPNHRDTKASFSWNIENGLWNCFGCGAKGNAYQLAVLLNKPNPTQYIDDNQSGEIRTYNPTHKTERKKMSTEQLNKMKSEYHANLTSDDTIFTDGLMIHGRRKKDGNLIWFYPDAIKHHKSSPNWVGNNTSCQIFGLEYLDEINPSQTLFIFEGEKDVVYSPYKAISFSGGCLSIPKDLSPLHPYKDIVILYDNDEKGKEGATKVADRITNEWDADVKIATWEETLPTSYDVYDDWEQSVSSTDYLFDETDRAIKSATLYKSNTNKPKGYNVMNVVQYANKYQNEELEHIVDNLLVNGGVTILAGSDGVGKSWLGLQMGFCISNGISFLDWETKQRPVLLIQFELGHAQLKDRINLLSKTYDANTSFNVVDLSNEDLIFSDAWEMIEQTIHNHKIEDGVIIVDNLYASTDKDTSVNQELKPILKRIRRMCFELDNSFVLIAHHNKNETNEEPILTKKLISGGKTLTNFPNNVFQIGSSCYGNDIFRGKITKVRDQGCDIINMPFILKFNPDTCVFERGSIIPNEVAHCKDKAKRWEYEMIIDFSLYQKEEHFNRKRLWEFLSTKDGWEKTPSNETKVTRFLHRMKAWMYIIELGYNHYALNLEEIGLLELEQSK